MKSWLYGPPGRRKKPPKAKLCASRNCVHHARAKCSSKEFSCGIKPARSSTRRASEAASASIAAGRSLCTPRAPVTASVNSEKLNGAGGETSTVDAFKNWQTFSFFRQATYPHAALGPDDCEPVATGNKLGESRRSHPPLSEQGPATTPGKAPPFHQLIRRPIRNPHQVTIGNFRCRSWF